MNVRPIVYVVFAVTTAFLAAAKPPELSAAKTLPEGLSKEVAALLAPEGFVVTGEKGPVCTVWLAKSVDVQPGFKPTLNVKYPFSMGQLIGVLQVPEKTKHHDFRGQEIPPGVYTLRYGKQPEDGNHIGTSDIFDFLLAIPAKNDTDPKPVAPLETLAKMSAKTAGGTHPAIFSLLPADKPAAKAALLHDKNKDFWILDATTTGKADKTDVPVPVRLVVIGESAA